MASKEEILKQIADLQAEADNMGDEDEFDVEIWNKDGEGARLPHGQTTRWLRSKFPDLFDPEPDPSDNDGKDDGKGNPPSDGGKSKPRTPATGRNSGTAQRYFAKRPTGK